jgi:hypothetical protein
MTLEIHENFGQKKRRSKDLLKVAGTGLEPVTFGL